MSEGDDAAGAKEVTASTTTKIVDDDELDALLDEALNDFDKPLPPPKSIPLKSHNTTSSNGEDMSQMWSEEFIQQATSQFEKKMRQYIQHSSSPSTQQSSRVGVESSSVFDPKEIEETLNEALKGVSPDLFTNPMGYNESHLAKLMGSLGMCGGESSDEKGLDDILPFMSSMMEKLLSKDLLYPVLSDLVERYPGWLDENREKISREKSQIYEKQYENMRRICEEYGKESEGDSEDIKKKRFDVISELMLEVQSAGPPPQELIGESGDEGNVFSTFDPRLGAQCSIS